MKNFLNFRATLVLAIVMVGASVFTSCDDSRLTARQAKKALSKHHKFRAGSATKEFPTGYYEVNLADLNSLAQLKAAEMVAFKVDTVLEVKKHSHYSWFGPTTYSYSETEHYFAAVSFTEKGQKYVVKDVPTMREDEEDDLKLLEEEPIEVLPSYMSATYQVLNDNPATEGDDEVAVDSVVVVQEPAVTPEEVAAEKKPAAEDPMAKDTYKAAVCRRNVQNHHVMIGENSVLKVKEVYCPEDFQKVGKGLCVAICEFDDKTPFGWVLGAPKEGERFKVEAEFVYYEDLGWVAVRVK